MRKIISSSSEIVIATFFLFTALTACTAYDESVDELPVPDMHTSQISLDWAGTYHGILPCADCSGIDKFIHLKADGTFEINRTYLGKSDSTYHTEGSFEWGPDGGTITLDIESAGVMPYHYRVGENLLIQLDLEGNRIDGELAELYNLEKIYNPLKGHHALLVEIPDIKVDSKSGEPRAQLPHIQFHPDDLKISGSGDCNNFFGSYQLRPDNRITFSDIASTRMACKVMDIDHALYEVFEKSYRFSIQNDTLFMVHSDGSTLARFLFASD